MSPSRAQCNNSEPAMAEDRIRIHISPWVIGNLACLCANALAEDSFQPCWIMPNGEYVVSFLSGEETYVGIIRAQKNEDTDDALMITAVYRVGSERWAAFISMLKKELSLCRD